jgi:Mrp family chromosome partitioning ATPase/capsular polysaccharide biosynthesis protein
MSASPGLDLPKLVALIKARAPLLLAITLIAAGLAFVVSLTQPQKYKASSVLLFGGIPSAEILVQGGAPDSSSATQETTTATNLALASLDSIVADVKRRLGTPASLDELKNAISIQGQGLSDTVKLTAEWRTPAGAALLATTFAEQVVAQRREMAQAEIQRAIDALNQTINADKATVAAGQQPSDDIATLQRRVAQLKVLKAVQTGDVRLAERAVPPQSASSPRPLFNAVAAGLVALLLGVGALVLLAGFDPRVRDESELAALINAPVLARIPEVARSRRFLFSGGRDEDASFLEAIQFLRLNVQRFRPQGRSAVVAVTSPMAGDGKTMVVAWLAQALAFNEAEVLAIDCDLRRPMLHTYFDAREEVGGALPNLRMVAASDPAALPGLTGHESPLELFAAARDRADYVLVDTSPVASVAHASAAAGAADGVILVVDLARIRRKDLLAAKEQLANAQAKLIGIVLNRAPADLVTYRPLAERVPNSDLASNY